MSKPTITPFSDAGEALIKTFLADLEKQEADNADLDRNAAFVARSVGPAVIRAMTALQDREISKEGILDAFVAVFANQIVTVVATVAGNGIIPPSHPLVMGVVDEFMGRVEGHIEEAVNSEHIMQEPFSIPKGGAA